MDLDPYPDPYPDLDPSESGSPPKFNPDLYLDTGMTCLGGGMHCPSASSY